MWRAIGIAAEPSRRMRGEERGVEGRVECEWAEERIYGKGWSRRVKVEHGAASQLKD